MAKNSKQARSFEEQMGAISAQLETVLAKLSIQEDKMDNLEKMLAATQAENVVLREELRNKDAEVTQLKNRLNSVEQTALRVCSAPHSGGRALQRPSPHHSCLRRPHRSGPHPAY